MSIPDRAVAYINKFPPAFSGTGGEGEKLTFSLAMKLVHGFCLDWEALPLMLVHYNPRCDKPWTDKELEHKVASAINTPPAQQRGWLCNSDDKGQATARPMSPRPKPKPPSPEECLAKCKEFTGDLIVSEQDLIKASPYKLTGKIQNEHSHRQGAMLAHNLFRPDDLINVVVNTFQDETSGKWKPADKGLTADRRITLNCLMDLPEIQHGAWIRFNPMKYGGVTDSQVARFDRCLLEFDNIPLDTQRAVLANLKLPISAIIYSGGRSYHAWVEVGAETVEEYKEVTEAVYDAYKPLGIDLSNQNPSRMSRMPGVMRDGQKQKLVYLNPEPSKKGIL